MLPLNKEKNCLLGTMLSEVQLPNMPRIFRACGFDFMIIDCEHGYFDCTAVANLVAVAKLSGILCLVRIAQVDRGSVQRYLDMGADGFLLAMTGTAHQIDSLVRFSKYPPQGERGISLQRSHSDYSPGKVVDYLQSANNATIVLAQIESKQGVENAMQIAATPGVDGLMIGPNDLTLNLGCVGQYNRPEVVQCFESVLSAAQTMQKPCGLISSDMNLLQKWKDAGMQLLSWNSEIGMILNEGKRAVSTLRQ